MLVPNLRSLAVRCLGAKYRYVYAQHFELLFLRRWADSVNAPVLRWWHRFMHFNPVVIWQDWRGRGVTFPTPSAAIAQTNHGVEAESVDETGEMALRADGKRSGQWGWTMLS